MQVQAPDPVRTARALFEAYRLGDREAMLRLTHSDVALSPYSWDSAEGHDGLRAAFDDWRDGLAQVEATPQSFELIPPETVLVGGRLRVFRRGLRDSPAWWLMRFRDGLWISGTSHATEAEARSAALVPLTV